MTAVFLLSLMVPPCGLDEVRFLESLIRSILRDSAERLCRNSYEYGLLDLWNKDSLLLKVRLTTCLAARIKLRRTSAV